MTHRLALAIDTPTLAGPGTTYMVHMRSADFGREIRRRYGMQQLKMMAAKAARLDAAVFDESEDVKYILGVALKCSDRPSGHSTAEIEEIYADSAMLAQDGLLAFVQKWASVRASRQFVDLHDYMVKNRTRRLAS
jgi:hypothetical protein